MYIHNVLFSLFTVDIKSLRTGVDEDIHNFDTIFFSERQMHREKTKLGMVHLFMVKLSWSFISTMHFVYSSMIYL